MSTTHSPQEKIQPEIMQRLRQLPTSRTAYRWRVWSEQAKQGIDPCFATDQRFTCNQTTCPWWDECQDLRVEWQR